jgi:hypothetical protein
VFTSMETWTEIRRRVLTGEISKRQACREYGIHWQTLSKILRQTEPVPFRLRQPHRRPKLDPFLPVIGRSLNPPPGTDWRGRKELEDAVGECIGPATDWILPAWESTGTTWTPGPLPRRTPATADGLSPRVVPRRPTRWCGGEPGRQAGVRRLTP